MKQRIIISRLLLIILISAWMLLPAGCGKKGPPRAPKQILPPPVNDLKANVVNGDMRLYWTVPPEPENVTTSLEGFFVFKASVVAREGMCDECPRQYILVGEPLIYSASQQENGRRVMTYTEKLRKGFRYTYKVRGFTEGRSSADDSNIIEFVYGVESEKEGQEK